MKKEKTIIIKNPKLRKLRNILRKILIEAGRQRYNDLRVLGKDTEKKYGYEDPRAREIQNEIKKLFSLLAYSICECNNGVSCLSLQKYKDNHQMEKFDFTDLDMAYYPKTKKWYCLECYKRTKAISEPENV